MTELPCMPITCDSRISQIPTPTDISHQVQISSDETRIYLYKSMKICMHINVLYNLCLHHPVNRGSREMGKAMPALFLTLLFSFATLSHSLPLSTNSRWIVEEPAGDRVKFACVNWAAHLKPMLAEGLDKQPLSAIARHVALMGFNCVRLTWATFMFTRYSNLTVAQSFHNLGLKKAMAGLEKYNPDLLDLTVIDAQKAVIEELGAHGVMVVLDNQMTTPMWCCSDDDGNGFFGDKYFNPKEWLRGLAIVAKRYKDTSMVVAMSLRNELRGPRQNETEWYRYVRKGALTIHHANPNLLVLVSGLAYDTDFTFLKTKPLGLKLDKKLVYEAHRYSFTDSQSDLWLNQSVNQVCDMVITEVKNKTGFLATGSNPAPLFVSEFGVNQMGVNQADNLFLGCFLAYLAELDLDWALWALQGSYYLRQGSLDTEETYGMLTANWTQLRSPQFHQKLQLIQQKIQDPKSRKSENKIMYHPMSGRCVRVDRNETHASDCWGMSHWSHDGDGTPVKLVGTPWCLTALGDGLPVILTAECYSEESTWRLVSGSKFQMANKDENGTDLCLDYDPSYSSSVLTKKCICSADDDSNCLENPESQWFQLLSTNAL
ncbi:hypothetical protein RJ640_018978 [Escallonia rubra]|uniref:Glycoside hydrolase family 5 domain-containing protein n=1 Tax=Escallonia rubra TaxID=112253 RepID=A0AA88U7I6_9ASTE|nr:hypothetical protein RJ640_018978 [Escallonia rubra]